MVYSPKPVSSEKESRRRERLDEIRTFIESLDSPADVDIQKLKFVFDLVDNELIEDYDQSLKWLEMANLENSCLTPLNNRRSEIEILAFMLNVMRHGANKTKILYQANLSYSQLRNYLKFLKEVGFVTEEGKRKRGRLFVTTSKGNHFLYHWMKILHLLKTDEQLEDEQIGNNPNALF